MLSVAGPLSRWPTYRMTEAPEITRQKRLGAALKALRESKGVTQPKAAEAMGVTLTAWQNYEAGRRQFKPALVRKVTQALGADSNDLEDFEAQLDEAPASRPIAPPDRRTLRLEIPVFGRAVMGERGPNVYDGGHEPESVIDIAAMLGPQARALRLAGESMIPYAEPGGFVIYQLDRWPRRGQGCVIETVGGEYYVKRYEKQDGSTLFATELHPEERVITWPLIEIKGVYAIGLRGD